MTQHGAGPFGRLTGTAADDLVMPMTTSQAAQERRHCLDCGRPLDMDPKVYDPERIGCPTCDPPKTDRSRAAELLEAATPLPWILPDPPDGVGEGMIYGSDGWAVVDSMLFEGDRAEQTKDWREPFTRPDGQHLANAAFIVYAVNRLPLYEEAVEALERLTAALDAYQPGTAGALEAADELEAADSEARAVLARLTEGESQ